jgi:mercuric ion binding protein
MGEVPGMTEVRSMRLLVILLTLLVLPSVTLDADVNATPAIKNMFRTTCAIIVREAIAKVLGVKTVAADFRKKLAVVTFDDTQASIDKLAAASRGAGFPAEHKE